MGFGGFGAFDGCTDKSSSQQPGFYGGRVKVIGQVIQIQDLGVLVK